MNVTFLEMWVDNRLTWQIYMGKMIKNKPQFQKAKKLDIFKVQQWQYAWESGSICCS